MILEDRNKEVTAKEYWNQNLIYAEMAVEIVKSDFYKLTELIRNLDHLPRPSFENVIEYLSSKDITNRTENERTKLWTELIDLISKHKRFSEAKWALEPKMVMKIEEVAKLHAPLNPLNRYHLLFSNKAFNLFDEKGDWKEQQQQLEEQRNEAVKQILDYGGLEAVIEFAKVVELPFNVGLSLSFINELVVDLAILPVLIQTKKI